MKRILTGPSLEPKSAILPSTSNARAPMARVTNAPYLFGDPFDDMGDPDELLGDFDPYGDVALNDATLAMYEAISGDPKRRVGNAAWNRLSPKAKMAIIGATSGIAGAGIGAGAAFLGQYLARKKKEKALNANLARYAGNQTLQRQKFMLGNAGAIDIKGTMPFFSVSGARLNASPVDPLSRFPASTLKWILDKQAIETPFQADIVTGTVVGTDIVATASGVAASRFFGPLMLQIGVNALSGVPSTAFRITATIPTIQGPLTISSTPFNFNIAKGFDVRFSLYPWILVTNKMYLISGEYNNANPIVVTISGLPATAATNVTLVVPGSEHPWVRSLRNSLLQGGAK